MFNRTPFGVNLPWWAPLKSIQTLRRARAEGARRTGGANPLFLRCARKTCVNAPFGGASLAKRGGSKPVAALNPEAKNDFAKP